MKKDVFLRNLVEELDLEDGEINQTSALHLTSLMRLSLISFLDEHFGVRVKATDLKGIDSVDTLMTLIGKDKFE